MAENRELEELFLAATKAATSDTEIDEIGAKIAQLRGASAEQDFSAGWDQGYGFGCVQGFCLGLCVAGLVYLILFLAFR